MPQRGNETGLLTETYVKWIRDGLGQNGKTQMGLADALGGLHRSQMTKLLQGKRKLKLDEIPLVAAYLELPVPEASRQANTDKALFDAAEAVRAKAYAPYSNFHVGAAILADDGKIYAGCNVENAAYPVGNCAEPSAIAAMLAGGGKRIKRIYVTGPGTTPVTPCGGCRQRIREFADLDVEVISHGVDGTPLVMTLGELLPHSFGPEFLGK